MTTDQQSNLERRVVAAAEAALERQRFVSAIDVLAGLGWLPFAHLDRWRQGRVDCLEDTMSVNPGKLAAAMRYLGLWARRRGLTASETTYVARTPDRRSLRFSVSGDPDTERAYRTHWMSPDLSDRQRARLIQRESRPPDLVVISPLNEWTCTRCGGTGSLLLMAEPGPVCLRCAGLDHLVFLPAGDAGLTRRARAASRESAVVVRFSRTRKRYERQGLLVEPTALEGLPHDVNDR